MNMQVDPRALMSLPADTTPSHDALALTAGGNLARIVLHGQVYSLRITRAGKLILTK
ncbi:hemin uptake protein HemP [Gemmobacter sp. LW-1]|jgi:hemin uptake protein HemP|uniref:Hemin uptake protein HemP n=2 Tax=Gemmobacter TaxID=204456 RepID=A0A2T6ARW0_9RHOB|nr:hemin uptake protein HemP [Gemmobacter caeni]TWI95407.1 hemin uptake protein HemP [Gemmobacter caeni]GHC22881.1 hemin uptake protein HemP [Gemmobacter nanjingensis]